MTRDEIIELYARHNGAFQVWKSWRDKMIAQGREVNEKFMQLPIPERDMQLDAQIAEDVIRDYFIWVENEFDENSQ